ncbi:Hint domain-containing protein [Aliiroseovarius sp. F47248L]|uniref:Hint domain-containing protein n=1 Tax=Aliiroseovarius sp. F47248L TaxID=2926420 RepID=UPI001FF582A1|nr:Hint domain-containing protein [Aliiroseovarius sp. F47248L]MCK0138701.1 Hint domain-containing protein [Aliiroseovarius sp. F47248L]
MRDIRVQESIPIHWTGFSSTSTVDDPMRGRHSRRGIASSGLSANTRVETLRGPVIARELQIGDQVKTYGGGYSTLRWVGTSRLGDDAGVPMRRTSFDGRESTTLVSSDQLVLVAHNQNDALFGTSEVMCPAVLLAAAGLFTPDPTVNPTIVHLLFDTYELVKCGDDWVESLRPDMDQIRTEDAETADEILSHLPKLVSRQGHAAYVRTRPVLDEREVALLFGA